MLRDSFGCWFENLKTAYSNNLVSTSTNPSKDLSNTDWFFTFHTMFVFLGERNELTSSKASTVGCLFFRVIKRYIFSVLTVPLSKCRFLSSFQIVRVWKGTLIFYFIDELFYWIILLRMCRVCFYQWRDINIF